MTGPARDNRKRMRFARRIVVGSLVSILGVAACTDPVCGCSPPIALGILYGTVSDDSGPVAGAEVYLPYLVPGRDQSCEWTARGTALSDSLGYYRMIIEGNQAEYCVLVYVRRGGSGVSGEQITAEPLRLALRYEDPPDSVRLDATLTITR